MESQPRTRFSLISSFVANKVSIPCLFQPATHQGANSRWLSYARNQVEGDLRIPPILISCLNEMHERSGYCSGTHRPHSWEPCGSLRCSQLPGGLWSQKVLSLPLTQGLCSDPEGVGWGPRLCFSKQIPDPRVLRPREPQVEKPDRLVLGLGCRSSCFHANEQGAAPGKPLLQEVGQQWPWVRAAVMPGLRAHDAQGHQRELGGRAWCGPIWGPEAWVRSGPSTQRWDPESCGPSERVWV